MRVLRSAAALAAILASSVVAAQTITFGDATPRQLPKEFEVGLTGGGPPHTTKSSVCRSGPKRSAAR